MKKILIILLFLCINLSFAEIFYTNKNFTYQGINWSAGLYELNDDDFIIRGTLAEDVSISGYKCKGGYEVVLNDKAELVYFYNAESIKINNIQIPALSLIYLNEKKISAFISVNDIDFNKYSFEKGKWIELYDDYSIANGYLAKDYRDGNISIKKGSKIYFHKNGKISRIDSVGEMLIEGYLLSSGNYFFNEEGKLITIGNLKLTENKKIDGILYKEDSEIVFNSFNEVKKGIIAEDILYKDIKIPSNSEITFNDAGYLEIIKSSKDIKYKNFILASGKNIGLSELGKLQSASLINSIPITNIYYGEFTNIITVSGLTYFLDNERISSSILVNDYKFLGMTFKAGTMAYFDRRGEFYKGTISEDYKYYNTIIPANSEVTIDENRAIKSIRIPKEITINKIKYPSGATISFFSTYDIVSNVIIPKGSIKINNVEYKSRVSFYDNETIREGVIANNMKIYNISFTSNITVYYNKKGKITSVKLSSDPMVINNIEYPALSFIYFDDKGKITNKIGE